MTNCEDFFSRPPAGLDRDEILRRIELLAAQPAENGDFSAVRDFFSADVVCEFVGDKSRIPYAGRHMGLDALLSILRAINIDFSQSEPSIDHIVIDGGRVALRRSVRWRHRGAGLEGRVDLADFVRFENGLIVELIEFRDSITILSIQGDAPWP
ncbi:nuclear transport factor 2 family protein [Methylosinus sp. Ce-a6]|uniref:nuclear transport factor 2 family protein n=1 Tax=Methylosinus sp. Ce-a6 TaxID=2172005 RepID=UPI001359A759|nr:nuclear transport factor 2 family protein [Methylosinus sp. Ce-a6]